MKNYPHLYTNILSKKAQIKSSKTPKKSTAFTGPSFTSKASSKTLAIYNSTLNREKKGNNRTLTRSIEEHHRSLNENEEFNYVCTTIGSEDEQLFSQSYSKIGKIKQDFPYKNIDLELNEVLRLIKEEKLRINEKLKNLKKSNDYYKKICEGYLGSRCDCAVNTEEIISSSHEKAVADAAVGSDPAQSIKIVEEQGGEGESIAKKEAYVRLSTMLEEMSINPQDILPSEERLGEQILINDYKALTDKETIKIQKFFIKKLIEKISK